MKTTAIIVTYADRSGYVKQVVERLISFDIYRIVIVDNNSVTASSRVLRELEASDNRIDLITLDTNTGSAYAYNRGIKAVLPDLKAEYIWLLDDDNLPASDAFRVLEENMAGEPDRGENGRVILSLIRDRRKVYMDAVWCSLPYLVPGRKNIFRSFHIASLLEHRPLADQSRKKGEVFAVPYGGMFFHRNVINNSGLADEQYYLYCDDFDYCCRFRSAGGKIILSLESGISDIEQSWNVQGSAIKSIATGDCLWRIYYSVRNRVYLEKKYLVDSWPVYAVNMIIYSAIVTLLALVKYRFRNILIYYTALCHGLSGRLGIDKNTGFKGMKA